MAIARQSNARAIGLDVDQIMSPERVGELSDSIARPDELEALERATGWDWALVLTLIFSAKETIFKALFSAVGRYFDFHDASVDRLDTTGRFAARLVTTLTPMLRAGLTLNGRFERSDATVCTGLVILP